MDNKNSEESLRKIELQCYQYLKDIESVPGIPFHDVINFLNMSYKQKNLYLDFFPRKLSFWCF